MTGTATAEPLARDIDIPHDYADLIEDMITRSIADGKRSGYPDGSWKRQSIADHLDHILKHVQNAIAGDTSEDHIGHAFTRLLMVEALREEDRISALNYVDADAENWADVLMDYANAMGGR